MNLFHGKPLQEPLQDIYDGNTALTASKLERNNIKERTAACLRSLKIQPQKLLTATDKGVYACIIRATVGHVLTNYKIILVYLNGNNAAEGENNIKYANSYPMN